METVYLRQEVLRTPLGLTLGEEELKAEKDSLHLACYNDKLLLGCVILLPVSDRLVRMRQMAVRESWRGRGIGKGLVEFCETVAAGKGFCEIVLNARETAVGFYLGLGYRAEGERFTLATIPHLLMRKRLQKQQ